jgi:hypothetical protein
MKKLKSIVLDTLIVFVFGLLFGVLMVEWFVGCGEYYIDSRGNVIPNECVFLDFPKGK